MTIGQHINLARNKHNMTLEKLAELSGVSKNTIVGWIYHDNHPDVEFLIKVADVLNITLDELVGRKMKETELKPYKRWFVREIEPDASGAYQYGVFEYDSPEDKPLVQLSRPKLIETFNKEWRAIRYIEQKAKEQRESRQ